MKPVLILPFVMPEPVPGMTENSISMLAHEKGEWPRFLTHCITTH